MPKTFGCQDDSDQDLLVGEEVEAQHELDLELFVFDCPQLCAVECEGVCK